MKKLLSILLILAMLCSFLACTPEQKLPDHSQGVTDAVTELPPQTDPEDTLPPQTDPTEQTLPPQTDPIPTLPLPTETLPPQTDPPPTLPLPTEPAETLPPQTEPPVTLPPETLPVQTEPVYTEPVETEPPTTEATHPQYPDPDGSYTSKDDVALYIHVYGCLPPNFITKSEARALGWKNGSLERYAPGKCIGGDRFQNREAILPQGHTYYECDIDTLGSYSGRGAKRIVYSTDGLIYYTDDHYESFTLLYG